MGAPYNDLVRAGQRLHGLMRTLLFKRLESSVEAFRQAEDLLRRIQRQQPELFNRIMTLPTAIRSAKTATPADKSAPKPPAVFFFGQAGDFQRLWLADGGGNIVAEDNHSSLTTIACLPTEKRQQLPTSYNQLVAAVKTKFDQQYQEYLATGGTPHRLSVSQRWVLDTIREAYKQATALLTAPADAKDAETRLERLRKLWSVTPLDARMEFALRGLRNQKPALEDAITCLESLAFEHKLDVLVDRHAEVSKLATDPLIICTEALV